MDNMYYYMYDITFAEILDETTLTFSITGCTRKCKGCHSIHLHERKGNILDYNTFNNILKKYKNYITAICFLGGDKEPFMSKLLEYIKLNYPKIKLGLYSGYNYVDKSIELHLDYLKLGQYIEHLGALDSESTNQKMYKIIENRRIDITSKYFK